MSRWFRFYEESLNDPKLLRLSDGLYRAWTMLLCFASKNDGILPAADDIAAALRAKPSKVSDWIEKLVSAGLIDRVGDHYEPHNWNGRQYKSDSSGDRVAKYREKRKASGLPVMGDYTQFRAALIARDGEQCVYCQSLTGLVVDHMEPIALGGTDDEDNLALACKPCNSGKSGRTPEMARKKILVLSAAAALARYRDKRKPVTVTETPPETEQKQTTEQIDKIAEPRASNFTEGSRALASAFWKALGFESPLQVPPEFAGVDWRAVGWENAGWTVDLIETEARRIGPDKPLSYHEKVFATTFAKRQAPLPIVEIREAEKVVSYGASQIRSGGSLTASIRRELAELEQSEGADFALPNGPLRLISN